MKRLRKWSVALMVLALVFPATYPATAATGSNVTTTGQTLTVTIDSPADGSRTNVPPGTVAVSGTAAIGPLTSSGNVAYVVDLSGSTQNNAGDCNDDGTVNLGDDFNGDSQFGRILDCEIAGVLALHGSLTGSPGASAGMVVFGGSAAIADVGFAGGQQDFLSPLSADANANGRPDIEDVARSLRYNIVQLFTNKNVGNLTNFDAALDQVRMIFQPKAGQKNIAFFLSDGQAQVLSTGAGSPLAAVTAAGIIVNTYSIGSGSTGCGPTAQLRIIADTTGGTCTNVADPSQLQSVLVNPATVTGVTVKLNGGAAMPAALGGGNWSINLSGLVGGIWNNIQATVTASDGTTASTSIQVYGNRAPVPSAGGPYFVAEGSAVMLNGSASDPDGDALTYAWSPAAHLSDTSVLSPVFTGLDDSVHALTLTATDPGGMSGSSSTTVTVQNVAPTIIIMNVLPAVVGVGAPVSGSATFTDPGTLDTHTAAWDWGDGTTSAGTVAGGSVTGSHTYSTAGVYTVTLTVTDDDGGFDTEVSRQVTVNQPPTANAGGPYTVNEGSAVMLNGSAADPDGDTPLTYEWSPAAHLSDAFIHNPIFHGMDNSVHNLTLTAKDPYGYTGASSTTVTVLNVPPSLSAISASLAPQPVGSTVSASATFTDPGTLDTHAAVFDWGDGSSSAGTVAGGSVTGSHVYTATGIYTVSLTVTDDDGGSDTELFRYVVVYDPNGGFVTGGGWIYSPAGAYAADPLAEGRANFGFVSKYKSGQSVPTGSTEFQFKAGNLNFHSSSYDWMVIAGARAQYKGTGTINGAGNYGFLLTAVDGQVSGGGGADKFRIKIWDKGTDTVVYDNQMGSGDDAAVSTVISGGSVVIHK